MHLIRTQPPKTLISLVPMVDVLLILLVFFMVTSTYRNLDMIPVIETSEPPGVGLSGDPATLLIHLTANGHPRIRGQEHDADSLSQLIRMQLSQNPLTSFVVLPSGGATTQHLVSLMDTATRAGATRLRIIRLETKAGADR